MRLGIIGNGLWGSVYAFVLREMGVDYRQMGRDWSAEGLDGIIIASSPDSHYSIAHHLIERGIPVLIEKPIALNGYSARRLLAVTSGSSIVFCGHTRLYSPAWREFKHRVTAMDVDTVRAEAGGPCKTDVLWDWGPHLMAMCLDIGFPPEHMHMEVSDTLMPLRFVVNCQYEFTDVKTDPAPLEVLLTEFMAAITKGEGNIADLELGVRVTEALEERWRSAA